MAGRAERRLNTDLRRILRQPPDGISAAPTEGNMKVWDARICGPVDCPFENGTYKVQLIFTNDYPDRPPQVKFITPIFHPNIYENGYVCVDVFDYKWKSSYDVYTILTFIQILMDQPNPENPANPEAANMYKYNRAVYDQRVRENVRQTWR